MNYDKPHATECPTCGRVAAFKMKASTLGRFTAHVLPPAHLRPSEADASPLQQAIADWSLSVGAFLRREMAPHPRCAACSILMGPGHLEAGTERLCGTCCDRRPANGAAVDMGISRKAIGRRGWLSDYAVEQ